MGLPRPRAPARLLISQIITNFMVDFRRKSTDEYRLRPDIALRDLFVVMRSVKQMPALLAPSLPTTPHRMPPPVQVSCSALLRKRTSSSGTILANVLENKERLGSMVIVSAFEARRTIGTNPEGLGA